MSELSDLKALAIDIAREAGDLARRRRDEGVAVAATKSSLADIVTDADREVEALIRARLERERPGDGFLGEESGAGESRSGLTWVVDPIDGTVNYSYGLPAYAVSLGVVRGEPTPATWTSQIGVVFNPATGELFSAAAGEGAFLGDRAIAVSEPGPAGALLGTGFAYDPQRRIEQFAVLQRVMPLARDIRRMGVASLDLAAVAAGRLDAYFEQGLWPWDHAAGEVLVREAGGICAGLDGAPVGRELIIAASAAFFPVLEQTVREAVLHS